MANALTRLLPGKRRRGPDIGGSRLNSKLGGSTTRWLESTLEVARWERVRAAGRRWAIWGGVLGGVLGVVAFAPAAWLASALDSASNGRIVLADAQGTIWSGDAVAVLTAGPGSRDARALPGRLAWTMKPSGLGLRLGFTQACCLNGEAVLLIKPGLGRVSTRVQGGPDWVGRWPAAWLSGLGTPWNTLDLGGAMRLSTNDLAIDWVQGSWHVTGSAELVLQDVSSRVTTLDRLGSYRLSLSGSTPDAPAILTLQTDDGALQLRGTGAWGQSGIKFSGEATAAEAQRGALDNLLNIIGRRQGDRSIITIG